MHSEIKIRQGQQMLTACFCILLTLMLVARDIFSISVSKYILLLIVALFIAIVPYESVIDMVAFMLPLLCGLPSNYIFVLLLIKMALCKKIDRKITIVYIVFVMVWEIAGITFYTQLLDNEVVKQIVFTWTFFSLLFSNEEFDYFRKLELYLLGTVLVCGVIVSYSILRAPSNWLYLFSKGWYRFGDVALDDIDGMTLRLNSNSLAYFSIIGIMVAIVLIRSRKSKMNVLYATMAFFLVIAGFLSVSRSWILVAILCSLIWLVSEMKGVKGMGITILAFAFGGFLVSKIIASYPELLGGILARLTDKSAEGGNGRTELLIEYGSRITNNVGMLLFGSGAAHYRQAYHMPTSIHNGSMQVLLSYGIVGGLLFAFGMAEPVYHTIYFTEKRIKLFYWLPMLSIVLFVQTIQFVNPAYLMMPYIIGVYSIQLGAREEQGKKR